MSFMEKYRNILILHFTVFIWGFTGVLGQLISVSALHLVWYRVLIAAIVLLLFSFFSKQEEQTSFRSILSFVGVGLLVGAHWVAFFHSIKISTVSVTLVTLSSLTLFTAVLEPLFERKTISIADVIVGIVIIFGIYLIFKFEFQYWEGITFGLFAALFASIFSILNRKLVKKHSPIIITLYEMLGAFLGVSVVLLATGQFNHEMILSSHDLIYLIVLGSVCTAFAYVLGVAVMKELSAFTVALTTNLEPVYGIILAVFILKQKEQMSLGFYGGAVVILAAVFLYPALKAKFSVGEKLPLA